MLILRALGLPTALTAGLDTARAADLQALDDRFAWPNAPKDPPRPTLALVGWRLDPPAAGPSPALAQTVARLADARQHLGYDLAGIGAWVPTPEELAGIRFALSLRCPVTIKRHIWLSADTLVDFSALAVQPNPPALPYPQALANMIAALAGDPSGGLPDEKLRSAQRAHDDALRRDLTRPLQD